tara:strand:- start:542 stop:904 length:363 start_codon:yes stop_codon:yes gene_type:complete
MGINSTEVAYNFGQLGSAFNNSTAVMTPPTGKVFVAITMLADTTFDNTDGLVADNDSAGAGLEYIGTGTAAHDASPATTSSGTGGTAVVVGSTFPEGITIYGRWTSINPASGMIVAYIGN